MALLNANLNQAALLRESRRLKEPDPAQVAVLAELGGADGICVQVRRDKRLIRDRDLYILREVVKSRLILELPPAEEVIEKALDVKPSAVFFVADQADIDAPVTGIDFQGAPVDFGAMVNRLAGAGITPGFFIEPDPDAIKGAVRAGAQAVLINATLFTQARTIDQAQDGLDRIDRTAQAAAKAELSVFAGRGIGYRNILPLAELGLIEEYIVGHALVARAMMVGFERAVADLLRHVRTETNVST